MSYSDLSVCMSRQVRLSSPKVQQDTSYKTEDLGQYLSTPAKASVVESIQEEVVIEAAEVSITTTEINDQSELVETSTDSTYEFTPYSNSTLNKLEWRQWVMKSKALSKEYKLLLFESWISQLG